MALKGKPGLKADAQTHRGLKFQFARVKYDLDQAVEKWPREGRERREGMKDGMKKMVGEELQAWYGSDGKVVFTATAKDWASAQKKLDDYLGGNNLAKDASYQVVAKGLPTDVTALFVMDAPRLALMM